MTNINWQADAKQVIKETMEHYTNPRPQYHGMSLDEMADIMLKRLHERNLAIHAMCDRADTAARGEA